MTRWSLVRSLALGATLVISAPLPAQDSHPAAHNVSQMKLVTFPGMATCALGSVQSGDPTKGPSIIYAKMDAGCVFPWHWHTPNEHIMVVSGTVSLQAKGEKAQPLRSGAFA